MGGWHREVGIVGIDVSKGKIDACIRSLPARLSKPSTPQGEDELIAWLRENGVGLAVMEASVGYERPWAEALRKAAIGVRIVDPKRVRFFAKSAGKLPKSDPIDAEMIAWFAETFATAAGPTPDPEREALDRLVTARALLVRVSVQIGQLGEHRQPRIVANARAAIAKTIKAQLGKLEAVIEAELAANAALADRAAITRSVPGLGPQVGAGVIAWLPELGHIGNKAAAALVGVAPYDDDRASTKANAASRVAAGRSVICSIWPPWPPPPATTPFSRPTTSGCGPGAKTARSRWSPACAN